MAVDEFLRTYQNTLLNKQGSINPLSQSNNTMVRPKLGIQQSNRAPVTVPGYGSAVPDWLAGRKSTAVNSYINSKNERTGDIAADYMQKAAGQIPVDKYGIVQDKTTPFDQLFQSQIESISRKGDLATQTEEAKNTWNFLQNSQPQLTQFKITNNGTVAPNSVGSGVNYTPGASSDNPGAKAVQMAIETYNNKTPYAWGGNSLSQGVDCSGLVQQIYSKLGITIPRQTYEQAKSGKQVSLNSLLPGDLVFYDTGSQDPNGIGKLSHVAIYIGNGQVIDARNTRSGIKMGAINIPGMGSPAMAVRPW